MVTNVPWLILLVPLIMAQNRSLNDTGTLRKKLKHYLLDGYDKTQIPLRVNSDPVNVSLHMWPYDILYVNEAKSSIKISGWLDYHWNDRFLQWDPSQWGNITHIFIQASELWLPKIDIFYSKEEGAGVTQCQECYCKLDHTGEILRGHYFAYSFPCKINVKYFPFDFQNCDLEVANWYLDDRQMDLQPYDTTNVDMSVFLPNEEWDLLNITVLRKNEYYNYGRFPSLTYKISIKRKPFYYICNLIIPTLIITTTAVIGYHMPATSSGVHQEKVKMGLTAILSIFILQLGISDKMPRTSDVIPLISIFYFCLVWILTSAILSTSMIILLEKQGIYGKPIPKWAAKIFLHKWFVSNVTSTNNPQWETSPRPTSQPAYLKMLSCHCDNVAGIAETTRLLSNGVRSPRIPRRPVSSGDYSGSDSNIFGNNAGCERPPPVAKSQPIAELLAGVTEVRKAVGRIEQNFNDARERKKLMATWARLADSVEKLSLSCFLIGIVLSVIFFIFHGWY